MAYSARWTATDQVPQRLLDGELLDGRRFGRFDAVDTSDGGDTGRSSLSFAWHESAGEHKMCIRDRPSTVHALSAAAMAELQRQHPALAAQIYRNLALHLSERLRSAARAWRRAAG